MENLTTEREAFELVRSKGSGGLLLSIAICGGIVWRARHIFVVFLDAGGGSKLGLMVRLAT